MIHPHKRLWLVPFLLIMASAALAQKPQITDREWQTWLDDFRPFLLPSEAAAAKKVPAADRDAFREMFWKRRTDTSTDPGTNLRAQLEARIRAADKRYRVNGKGPWNDCGRTYVLLGKPDFVRNEVSQEHFKGDGLANFRDQDDKLAETWTYRAHPRLPPTPEGILFRFTTGCDAFGSPQLFRLLDQVAASYVAPTPR